MEIEELKATAEKKIWSNDAWKRKVKEWAAEQKIPEAYINHYKKTDRDSVTFVAVEGKGQLEKKDLLGIVICDKWVGHKGIENQVYIGLLLGNNAKICGQLVKKVEEFASLRQWQGYTFQFVSSICLESQLPIFHDAGFRQGFEGAACKGKAAHEAPIVPSGPGGGKGGKGAKLYEIHKCVTDI